MKKFFYLMSLCLCMFMGASVLTSCGDDDEEKVAIDMSKLQPGTVEEGNTLQKTVIYSDHALILTATFDNDGKCTSFTQQFVFDSAAVAQEAWTAYENDGEFEDVENWSMTSNVITHDFTERFKGSSKQDVKDFFENF